METETNGPSLKLQDNEIYDLGHSMSNDQKTCSLVHIKLNENVILISNWSA